jgi:LytS/YehU family sensor histidine kinase
MPLHMNAPATPPVSSGISDSRNLGRWLWEQERAGVPICLGMATFLWMLQGHGFWNNVVYSFCIGQLIQFSIEGGRQGFDWWLHRNAPPSTEARKRWPGWGYMGPWVVICSLGGYWLGMHLGDLLTGNHNAVALRQGQWRMLGPILVITLSVSIIASYYFYSQGKLASLQAQTEAAERAAAENQLRLLQSQLEPHMLFNTLANLRVLITLDPPRAQAMLDQLVSFLRATLQASRQASHPLSDEFARVQDYLALMQVRMGERLQFSLDLPAALRHTQVPPLLLQPLVENSIKHGLEPKREGGRITLSAQQVGAQLVLKVRDTGVGLNAPAAEAGTGFGMEQVRRRLAALHGAQAQVQLQPAMDAEGGTLTTLTLPLPTP